MHVLELHTAVTHDDNRGSNPVLRAAAMHTGLELEVPAVRRVQVGAAGNTPENFQTSFNHICLACEKPPYM